MKVRTLKKMLESIPDHYDLRVLPTGTMNDRYSSQVTGINVRHRKHGTEGDVSFRYAKAKKCTCYDESRKPNEPCELHGA